MPFLNQATSITPPVLCKACWMHGPPHGWDRSAAPVIPKTKYGLLQALRLAVPHLEPEFKDLLQPELKSFFRKHVRGERHAADPLKGASGLKKDELMARLATHEISFRSSETKGALLLKLRAHWDEQRRLGDDFPPAKNTSTKSGTTPKRFGDDSSDSSWELVE